MIGVSPPSSRNGVPPISPHVMSGLSAANPGCGEGVLTKLNPRTFGVSDADCAFPSIPIRSPFV